MTVNLEGGAPYAPGTAIIGIIERHRGSGIPAPVTLQTLERLGISESLRPRTIQALKLLDFIEDNGELTPEFVNLRKVPTPEYKPKLAEMLRSVYADVFAIVEPSGATYEQVSDAFRGFKPSGQLSRMVTLFLALLAHTEAWPNLPSPRAATTGPGAPKPARKGAAPKPPKPGRQDPEKPNDDHRKPDETRQHPPTDSYSHTVELAGGAGTVTLSATVNPFALKGAVREFFFSLVDQMDAYETSGSQK